MQVSLAELRRIYVEEGRPLPKDVEARLRADDRVGAQSLLATIDRRRRANRAEGQRLRRMLTYESDLWAGGVDAVAGVDEAGMSPLAGPVAAASVILPPGCRIAGVDDSKKLTPEVREALAAQIREQAVAYSVAFVEAEEIDEINIYRAGLLAMQRAVEGLETRPGALLIDARRLPEVPIQQISLVQGDAKSLSIAAASILAKTARDQRMRSLAETYPGYGFEAHKGYPVKAHVEALERLGPCPVHRRSFAPVRKALGLEPAQGELFGDEPFNPPGTAPRER